MKFRYGKVIDAHVHPAGPGPGDRKDVDWKEYKKEFMKIMNLAERERPLTLAGKMDEHGVHMAIALCSIGLPNENDRIVEVVQQYPDRFPACFVGFNVPMPKPYELDGEKAAREIEPYLKMPEVKGVGEWPLMIAGGMDTWPELWARYRPIMDVIAENNVAVLFHTGVDPYPIGYPRKRGNGTPGFGASRAMYYSNPVFIDDIATEYPEVPIIIAHIGVQGFYYFGSYADMALMVAARHENVYLETSSAPLEVVEKAVCDPAIGPERVLFGSDSPAPYGYYKYRGRDYVSYMKNPPEHLVDHYKYDLANIDQLPITDRQKEQILGENIATLLGLDEATHRGEVRAEGTDTEEAEKTAGTSLSIDSTIGEILDDEQGQAVLAKYVPADVLNSPQVEMAKGMTLRVMAPMSQGLITDEILQSIDEDLRKG